MLEGRIDVEVSDGTQSFFGRMVEALKAGIVYTARLVNPTYGLIATGLVFAEKVMKAYSGIKNYFSYKDDNAELADAYGYRSALDTLGAAAIAVAPWSVALGNLGYGSIELYQNKRYGLGYETIQKHENKPNDSEEKEE